MSGTVEKSLRAGLTDAGRELAMDADYRTPNQRCADSARAEGVYGTLVRELGFDPLAEKRRSIFRSTPPNGVSDNQGGSP